MAFSIIDTATNTVAAGAPIPFGATGVVLILDGKHAYVSIYNTPEVSIVDRQTNTVIANIPVDLGPTSIAITPPRVPRSPDDCKGNNYLDWGIPAGPFKNQGQCMKYLNTVLP